MVLFIHLVISVLLRKAIFFPIYNEKKNLFLALNFKLACKKKSYQVQLMNRLDVSKQTNKIKFTFLFVCMPQIKIKAMIETNLTRLHHLIWN